uniref:Tr-type G domain-containing protein n=1 Tax=Aegilops tauschii subsp. strangulata TaxID=200361 RepID=A0A453AI90_AEGTS
LHRGESPDPSNPKTLDAAARQHLRRRAQLPRSPRPAGMEHDAPPAPSHHAQDDGAVDDWARDDAEPSDRHAAPAEESPEAADAPAAPAPSAEGVNDIQSSLQSLELKTNAAAHEDVQMVADEEEEAKRHINLVFIGHVDAGKSTAGGQILFLSGQVDDRTIQKYEKEAKDKSRESWYMAYIMDTNEEERLKVSLHYGCLMISVLKLYSSFTLSLACVQGKTVEVGRAHFETENTRFTILDAPGHKSYVPNMISGASQADIGVLVISARKGEFETGYERGGQTREHVLLAKTLGVAKLVVVINKMDEPTVQWSKERYDEIEGKMIPFLRSSGYNVKK